MTDDHDALTLEYWRIVRRFRRVPLPRADKFLAESEAAYRRARAARDAPELSQLDLDPVFFQSK